MTTDNSNVCASCGYRSGYVGTAVTALAIWEWVVSPPRITRVYSVRTDIYEWWCPDGAYEGRADILLRLAPAFEEAAEWMTKNVGDDWQMSGAEGLYAWDYDWIPAVMVALMGRHGHPDKIGPNSVIEAFAAIVSYDWEANSDGPAADEAEL
tara:strand:+ start:5279 stop:5734 length:456 start_codon:yes stop_codon:yes gene_type:complete